MTPRHGGGLVLSLDAPAAALPAVAGPKAAGAARLRASGLPVPPGFCVTAEAYRRQLAATGLSEVAARVMSDDDAEARSAMVRMRVGLLESPLEPALVEELQAASTALGEDVVVAVRSSALAEGAALSWAGQFDSLLGVAGPGEVVTAVRACWASLWSRRAVSYAVAHGTDPSRNAMAVLVQSLVDARAAGGAVTGDEDIVVSASWGLGAVVAQGVVVPDRFVVDRRPLAVASRQAGRKEQRLAWDGRLGLAWRPVDPATVVALSLTDDEVVTLARLVIRAEATMTPPVEVEWALGDGGFQIVQVRAAYGGAGDTAADPGDGGLRGQPTGTGRVEGIARIVRSESELVRVGFGEVLVTRVPGPALAAVFPRVIGIVAELGGSTTHVASLARERGIPAVLGVADATRRIPDGARVLVDGTAGIVRPLEEASTATLPPRPDEAHGDHAH